MSKHPSHLKVRGHLVEALAAVKDGPVILYEGVWPHYHFASWLLTYFFKNLM